MASVFFCDLALSLGAKLVSATDRLSFFFSSIQAFFPSEGDKTNCARILHDPVGRPPRHVC